jgi:predicted ester cyclase
VSLEANKQIARDYLQLVFNEHRPDRAPGYLTPDVAWHSGTLGTIEGAENVGNMLTGFIGALPDLHAEEQDIVPEGDTVVVRLVVTATQQGDLLGIPATGKQIRWDAVDIYRITDGKISEEWAGDDAAAIAAQLGVFAPPWLG